MVEGFKHTEVGLIPIDWEVRQLNQLGHFRKGRNIPKSSILEYGVPCVLYGEIYTKYNFYSNKLFSSTSNEVAKTSTEIKKGDVLFAGSGETAEDIGKCFTYTGNETAYAGGDVIVFTPKECEPLFLGFLLNSLAVVKQKSYMGQGSSVFHIYPSNLATIKIPLPPTKAEQTAIATALNDADALIQKLEQLIAKKRNIKTGAMQELLKPKEGWEVKKLGEIVDINMGQSPDSKNYNSNQIGMPLLQGNADLENRKQLIRFWTSQTTKTCDAGDLILTVRAPVGSIGVAIKKSCIGRGVCSLKPKSVSKDFLYHLLIYKEKDWKILEQGSTFTSANSNQIYGFEISIPKTETEQTRIAQILSDIDNEIRELETQLEKYKMIKQGMMQSLLTGKIRLV